MKKLLYLFATTLLLSVATTSCTEEEVKPQTELMNGGGMGDEKVQK